MNTRAAHAEAEPFSKRALAIYEKTLGPDHPYVATALGNLAELSDDQGRYADAEPLYKRALAIEEKTLGPNHRDVAVSLNNLASLYSNQGRYAEAEPLYKGSLAISGKTRSVRIILLLRRRWATWLNSIAIKVVMPKPSRSTNARWRSRKRR